MRSVIYSMSVSLDGYIAGPGRQLRLDDARRGGLSLLHRSDAGACRACDGSTALRDDAVLADGRPKSGAGL
jgi:hypothetical protein